MEDENQRIPSPPPRGMTAHEILEREGRRPVGRPPEDRPQPSYPANDVRANAGIGGGYGEVAFTATPRPAAIFTGLDMAADRRNELIQVARNCVMLFDSAHVTGAEQCYVGRLCQTMLEFHV